MRRVGVLMSTAADDPESQLRLVALVQGLQQAGTVGRNLQLDTRWAAGDTARLRRYSTELLALSPDIVVAGGRVASVVALIMGCRRNFHGRVERSGTGYRFVPL